jgi:hypothetical protein
VRRYNASEVSFITACFIQLFGWDIESLLLTAHQKRCQVFLAAGRSDEALEAYKYTMDTIDGSAKAGCLDWSYGKSSVMSPGVIILTHTLCRVQGEI